jgi:ADP-heptose:LPS heptosyltransferase
MNAGRITVCVATKNRTDMLHQLLWSLIRQEYRDWDLALVDDSDEPVRWDALGVYPRLFNEINRTGHDIRITQGPRVGRIGAAYQVGFNAADKKNPLFFRVDDDAWLEPDYLAKLASIAANEDVGACGGLFLHPGREIETLFPGDPRYCHATIDGLSDDFNIQWFKHASDDPIPVEHLTANILFKRERLESIGGFETSLFRQHRDETQVTWRLRVEGAELLVHPAAVAWHLRGTAGGARGNPPDVYLEDHRRFMAQRKTMRPGVHVNLGHAIGDGFMATPMLSVLRRRNPEKNIAVFAPWAAAVLPGSPDVDAIAEHPLDAQRTVRIERSVYGWASANKWKGHLAEAYCRMLDLPPPDDLTPRCFLDDTARPDDLPDEDFILIAPWSNAKTFDYYRESGNKNWPLERWDAVVEWARSKNLKVVRIRGSEEEPLIPGVDLDVCGRPLREALSFIAHARMLVSVDTMAHHAAAAFGTPSVVLWGRSRPECFGYRKDNIINIAGECPGIPVQRRIREQGSDEPAPLTVIQPRPCVNDDQWAMDQRVCPIEGHPCMSSVSVESVLEAMERLHRDFEAPRVKVRAPGVQDESEPIRVAR